MEEDQIIAPLIFAFNLYTFLYESFNFRSTMAFASSLKTSSMRRYSWSYGGGEWHFCFKVLYTPFWLKFVVVSDSFSFHFVLKLHNCYCTYMLHDCYMYVIAIGTQTHFLFCKTWIFTSLSKPFYFFKEANSFPPFCRYAILAPISVAFFFYRLCTIMFDQLYIYLLLAVYLF